MFLFAGAEVNVHDRDGNTPLHLAVGGRVEGYGKVSVSPSNVSLWKGWGGVGGGSCRSICWGSGRMGGVSFVDLLVLGT